MKRLTRVLVAMVLCLGMLLAGCGGGGESGDKKHPVLRVRMYTGATQLDPQYSGGADYSVFGQIFDKLVRFDGGDQMTVLPQLAEKWEISPDGLEYTFHLVETKWHDGSDFTADDVVFTVERFLESPYTATKAYMIKGAEKIDERTVKITLNFSYPGFIRQLASWPWGIVSKAAVEQYGNGTPEMVIGTGPYKLKDWDVASGNVTLEVNEDYFGEKPYFDAIEFKVIADDNTALTSFENGELDIVNLLNGNDVERIKNDSNYTVWTVQRTGAYTLVFNTQKQPMDNKLVRQAISHAIDKEAMVELVWDGEANPDCDSILSPGEEGYCDDWTTYDYDPEKAKALLKEAGYENGLTIDFTYSTSGYGEKLATAVKDQLSAVGITINPVPLEAGAYITAQQSGDYTMTYVEWQSIPYNMPLVYNLYFISTAYLNYSRFNSPEIDELAMKAIVELDDETRIGYYEEAQRIIMDEAYYVAIGYIVTNYATPKEMKGLEFEPNTMISQMADWYWEE